MKIFYKLLFTIITAVAIFLPASAHSQSQEEIQAYNVDIQINKDSSIDIKEEINYYFPSEKHGIYRDIPYRYYDSTQKKYFNTEIALQSVTDDKNLPWEHSTSKDKNYLNIKIGDPNKTVSGPQTYIINYKVTGVLNYFDDHDELYWNVTGDKWPVPIENVSVNVRLPDEVDITSIQKTCYTGPTGGKEQNCASAISGNSIIYVASSGPLTIVAGWNKGVVTPITRRYEFSLRRESGWYWLLPLLVVFLMIYLYFNKGRDPAGRGTIAPEFEPPDKLLPAEMGALIDEKADNHDITATIIDLAVKGYLKIKAQEKKGFFSSSKEYSLIKVKDIDTNMADFEKDIFEAVFSEKKEVKLRDLYTGFDKLSDIKNKIYDNLVQRKYFIKKPTAVKAKYLILGILIASFSGIFFWLSWNLVFALGFSGIVVIIFSFFMPKKTREGVIAKEKSLGFKEFLYRAERYRVKWQEKEHIFEKYLPYAMIFGIAEVWAKNFAGIYKEPPSWFQGDFATFSTVAFASELSNFSTTASHSYSPPSTSASGGSSGFGGGGSSGGGMGGGGGGSW